MRVPRLIAFAALSLLVVSRAPAVTMAWTPIGNPGNACDRQAVTVCYGTVGYSYSIGTYEVTNAQYAEFLNAKAKSDPLGLYHVDMGIPGNSAPDGWGGFGGIVRSGSDGSYAYAPIAGRENWPVNHVSLYDATRFANWLNNGQGNGDTETGSYTWLGGTEIPSNGNVITRNAGANIFLPSENEWYKAAYYDPSTSGYYRYTTGSNTFPTCTAPTASPNSANCDAGFQDDDPTDPDVDHFTPIGSFPGSASPYGTLDQGGNVAEWNEMFIGPGVRGMRGGYFTASAFGLSSLSRDSGSPEVHYYFAGFRLVSVAPEPGTGLLVIAGLLGLGIRRRVRV
jgi:formylglycine-generating enzyme required for sulfatase activity